MHIEDPQMSKYSELVKEHSSMLGKGTAWAALNPEYIARMQLQNRFNTGLDIARYTANITQGYGRL